MYNLVLHVTWHVLKEINELELRVVTIPLGEIQIAHDNSVHFKDQALI